MLLTVVLLGAMPQAAGAASYTLADRDTVSTSAPATNTVAYIVVYKDGVSAIKKAKAAGVTTELVYEAAIDGFAAELSVQQLAKLRTDSDVKVIVEDHMEGYFTADGPPNPNPIVPQTDIPQFVPRGVLRIGGLQSPTADIDGVDDRVDVDVAILDSGIQSDNTDLDVAGGINCVGKGTSYEDTEGHGTHVAGTVGALDNAYGVVGVAPGARVWAVRVLNKRLFGNDSWILCGIDWVTANASTIEVANMSLGGRGTDAGGCTAGSRDVIHLAICASVAAGVTYTVSAGNDAADASTQSPAAYDEVITVSALSDWDGAPGGTGGVTCDGSADDVFAPFSNFGADVDLAAPGVCIPSTYLSNQIYRQSGTSMAAPHVAGAAALYKANHPLASPGAVRTALIAERELFVMPGDPDGIDEGVVSVRGL